MRLLMQVRRGHLVYDPFVGTGSILVAASHFGAHTFGADIDIRVVRDGMLHLVPTISTCSMPLWSALLPVISGHLKRVRLWPFRVQIAFVQDVPYAVSVV